MMVHLDDFKLFIFIFYIIFIVIYDYEGKRTSLNVRYNASRTKVKPYLASSTIFCNVFSNSYKITVTVYNCENSNI